MDVLRTASASGTTLAALAAEFRVLPLTPAWNTVRMAMERLDRMLKDGERPYEQMEADGRLVTEYARMLEANMPSVGNALACALYLSGDAGSRQKRIDRGLGVLSPILGLAHTSAQDTALRIGLCAAALATIIDPQRAIAIAARQPSAWHGEVAEILRTVEGIKGDATPKLGEAVASSWSSWLARFNQVYIEETTFFSPGPDDLRCAAARTGPAAYLKLDLQEVTVRDWSTAWRAASDGVDEVPRWLAICAAHALGFHAMALQEMQFVLSGRNLSADVRDRLEPWTEYLTRQAAGGDMRSILVVAAEGSDLTASWRPSPTTACFITTRGSFHLAGLQMSNFAAVLLELDPQRSTALSRQSATDLLNDLGPTSPPWTGPVGVLLSQPPSASLRPSVPILHNVSGIDQVAERLFVPTS